MNKFVDQMKKWYHQYEETFWYLVFGGLTTFLNIGVFYVLHRVMLWNEESANAWAWIAGVIFAFVTNKLFVFKSRSWTLKKFAWEFGSFVSARLFSGIFDMVFLLFFTKWVLHFDAMIIKVISNVIVIIMNYVFSKWIIFKK